MSSSRIAKSSLGTFATRVSMSVAEFLGMLYVAKVVGASTLGTYSLFVALVAVASLVTDFGVGDAATKRISEGRTPAAFLTASLALRLGLFGVIALVAVAFRGELAAYVGNGAAVPFLVVASLLLVGRRTVEAGLHGRKKVARAGLVQFVFSAGKLAAWLVLLSLGYGLVGLFVGLVAGQALAIIAGVIMLGLGIARPGPEQFRSLLSFVRYSWLDSVKDTTWVWTDTIVLGFFVTPLFIGVYELSWLVSGVFFFVASAISSTLFANVSEMAARDETEAIGELVETALVYTGIVAIPGLVGAGLFGERVLRPFGAEYLLGREVLVVLLVARVAHSYGVVFGKVIDALDRPDLTFRVNATFIVLNVVGNVVAIATVGWRGAAVATLLAMAVKTVLAYRYIAKLVAFAVPTRAILLEGVAAAAMGTMLYPFLASAPRSLVATVSLVTVGAVVYAGLILVLVGEVRRGVRDFVAA